MKIWQQYGSEHSANLVMIGHFENVVDATRAKEIIDKLTEKVREEESLGTRTLGEPSARYSSAMSDLLLKLNVMSIGPTELEQLLYDVNVNVKGSTIVVTTEEIEVSAFLKILFDQGARIEVYSAHNHPDSEYGRGRR